jgi:polyphosphate kinase
VKVDKRGKVLLNSQMYFCDWAKKRALKPVDPVKSRTFTPAEPVEE